MLVTITANLNARIRDVNMLNRLREQRAKHGRSQAVMEGNLIVSRQTCNTTKTEKFNPSLILAFKLAIVFSQTTEEIIEYEGNT